MKKEIGKMFMLAATALLSASVGSVALADDADLAIQDVKLSIKGYEFGPAVPKVLVELDQAVSKVSKKDLQVTTAGVKRDISKVYLSDQDGKKTKDKESKYVTIQMPVTYSLEDPSKNASPFFYNMEVFHNQWVEEYKVDIQGLTVTAKDETVSLDTEKDAINNRLSPDSQAFANKGTYSASYENPFSKEEEELSLNYAAYEPEKLKDGQKNPLVIWLHGQGEGGTDTDITLLGNEVVALAKAKIQDHFTAGDQTGAYVLAVQTPTYWMDEGDGTNGSGAGSSRYTEILMATIEDYVASNPDIDSKRIYLSGGSNGGYMTLNMAIHYPDYFAALVPQAAAYSYYDYERNDDGSYKKVEDKDSFTGESAVITDKVWFDDDKVEAIKDIPMWFIHAEADQVVLPENYALPVYKALLDSGASNKWFSYYKTVKGSDMKDTTYNGHWSWIYFFNDQVTGVQDVKAIKNAGDLSAFKANDKQQGGKSKAKVDGQSYNNIFDWLNAQSK